ncbi:polysaccharide deacetylase family protein [Nonomuraea sp. C10]|nr:polysaccharide deacetylase family protein [Nonomuraea sp. C10]TXK42214.1 polysaccharide deacetylase family protein [Nonomuraea sp. C10]
MTERSSPAYPPGQRSALCLTFDLDAHTMWTSKDPGNAARPAVLSSGDYDLGQGLDLVLGLLAEHGIRTTFFVPSDVAADAPGAIGKIVAEGHEIAMHGTDHNPLPDRSRPAEAALLRTVKDTLEQVSGTPVRGYRAPLYDVTEHTRDVLAEIGCTFSSNFMDAVRPYVVRGEHGPVAEIPTHWALDDGPHLLFANSPPNYRQFLANDQIARIWTDELRAIHALGGVTTMVLHPQLVGRPSRVALLTRLIETAEELGEVWLPTMGELAAHLLDQEVTRWMTRRCC